MSGDETKDINGKLLRVKRHRIGPTSWRGSKTKIHNEDLHKETCKKCETSKVCGW